MIEGAEEEVFNAFAAIKRDSRHRDVKLVYSKAISEPAVPSAAMGCAGISGACPDLLIPTLLKQGSAEAHEVAASSLVKQMLQRARTGDIELPPVASIKPATQRQTH